MIEKNLVVDIRDFQKSELVFAVKSMYGQNLPVILTFNCVKMLKQILSCQYFGPNFFEMIKRKKCPNLDYKIQIL